MTFLKRLLAGLMLLGLSATPALPANSWYDFVTNEPSTSVSGGVNASETVLPSQVNDAMRAWKQLEAAWLDDVGAVNTVGGTSTAITVTLSQGFTAYGTGAGQIPNGAVIAIKTTSAATGATTLNVNAIGTKAIRRQGDSAIQANDWLSGATLLLRYDTAYNAAVGAWVLLDGEYSTLSSLGGLGTGVATWLATPSSANLASAVTGETGSGALVFDTSPTFTTSANLTTTAAGAVSTATSTDAGAAAGPTVDLYRNSASPAASDVLGTLEFTGKDVGATKQTYAALRAYVVDTQSAKVDGRVAILVGDSASSSLANGLDITPAGIKIGNSSDRLTYSTGGWSPTITSSSGTITSVSVTRAVYVKNGKTVTCWLNFTVTTNGTGSGQIRITTPFTMADTFDVFGSMILGGTNVSNGISVSSTSTVSLVKYDGTYPATSGSQFFGGFTFQSAN